MKTLRLFVLVVALSAPALANDFYVDAAAGSDSNPGTAEQPFRTIQKGVDATSNGRHDRVVVNRGTYAESVLVSGRSDISLVGVGEPSIQGQVRGLRVYGSSAITVEGIGFRGCSIGFNFTGSSVITFLRCTFANNGHGFAGENTSSNVSFRECTFCCNNLAGGQPWGNNWTFERCTFAGNDHALENSAGALLVRNCIVAFNTSYGVREVQGSSLQFCDFFSNGADGAQHYLQGQPGANDVHVDPGFVDLASNQFSLRSDSPMINAGRDDEGLPVTIGAHEIGVVSSAAAGADVAFSSWTDAAGRAVTDPASQVTLSADGFLRLNGVATASALSPVIDLGDSAALTSNAVYRAIEDAARPSGSKRVVDADNTTFAREFELRASDTQFGALDASPAWTSTSSNAAISLHGRYIQLRITLTTQGQ